MTAQINWFIISSKDKEETEDEVNQLDKDGNNALHYLLMYFDSNTESSREKVMELLDSGINANHYNNESFTPLHFAIKYKQIQAIKFWVQANKEAQNRGEEEIFNFELRSKNNYTCLHLAWLYCFGKFLDLLIKDPYLTSKLSFLDRDKINRKPSELVLFNSQFFK